MPPAFALTYGIAKPEDVSAMTGREMLQAMIEGKLPAPPIAQTLGFWLVEVGDGQCVFEGETGSHLLNPLGGVHGGWALTLIDSATGCAAHTVLPAGVSYATVETKANFTRPIKHDTGRCAPRDASSAAAARSSRRKRACSTPAAAFFRTGPRRSWSSATERRVNRPTARERAPVNGKNEDTRLSGQANL